jgi:hypothetical protein
VGASAKALPDVERVWHICDSQDQVMAVAFRKKSVKCLKLLFPRSEVAGALRTYRGTSLIRNSPPPRTTT